MGKEVIRVVAAVFEHDGRYLITQRRSATVAGYGRASAGSLHEYIVSWTW